MRRYKGFNFVELMLVMAVLGVIIALTFPLLKNIKDDDDVYRAYMKKATQDVTDALSMALIKNRFVRDVSYLEKDGIVNDLYEGVNGVGTRDFLNSAIGGKTCAGTNCLSEVKFKNSPTDPSKKVEVSLANKPGIILGGSAALMVDTSVKSIDVAEPHKSIYAHIYVDMNGNKSPNQLCKDRYRFILYKDRVGLDESIDGCSLEMKSK